MSGGRNKKNMPKTLIRFALGLLVPVAVMAQTVNGDPVKPGTRRILTTPSLGQRA